LFTERQTNQQWQQAHNSLSLGGVNRMTTANKAVAD